jgi:uncharacterized delta-60 repeat protein
MLTVSVFRSFWRRFGLAVLALIAPALFGQTPAVADGFDPNVDGVVNALAVQPNGQILFGGLFTRVWPAGTVNPSSRNNLARINADGSVDTAFNPNVNGQVSALMRQPDGKIVIAGKFTSVAGVTRNRIARLNADGTLDAAFNPNAGGGLTPQVNVVTLQSDGKILIGGGFTTIGTTTRNRIARLNADGSLDTAFDPNANSMVWAITIQRNGQILIGGGFTTLQPNNAAAPTPRSRLARLNTDGTLDDSFDPAPDNLVAAIVVQADDSIIIGGNFATLGKDTPVARGHIAGLLTDGSLYTDFAPEANANVTALALQADGRLLVAGYFTTLRTNSSSAVSSRGYVGRFNTDGSLDGDFNPNANYVVLAMAIQADGRILLAGNFTTIYPKYFNTPTTRNHLARVNPDGGVDKTFEPDASGRPVAVATQADGKLLVAGTFTSIGGETRQGFGRLNTDGSVDLSFNPKISGPVRVILVQSDGRILIGGSFALVNDVARGNFARLNADGTLDTAFNPNPNGQLYALAQQSDGKIILGGSFSTVTRHNNVDPDTADTDSDIRYRSNIARINLDGTLDDIFDPTTDGGVAAIKIQPDGKILIGGAFVSLRPNGSVFSATNVGIARLNTDGTLANVFDPAPNASVFTIALQADGKVIIGGNFTNISQHNNTDPDPKDNDNDRRPRNRLARLNADGTLDTTYDPNVNGQVHTLALQADGKLLAGGNFTTAQPNGANDFTLRKYFARFNADGTLDASFDLFLNESVDSQVNNVILQSDQKIVLVGGFTSLQPNGVGSPVVRTHIARVLPTGAVDSAFNPAISGQFSAQINAVAIQTDGKVIAGGVFAGYGGSTSSNIARFLSDSSPDTAFIPSINGPVNAILAPPTGESVATQSNGFAWLTSTGRLNSSFVSTIESRLTGQVTAIAVQADGKVLVGGGFTTPGAAAGGNLVRFNTDGSLDLSFKPNPDSYIQTIGLKSDGKIVVGGTFTLIGGVAQSYLARLNADGSLDSSWAPTPDGSVSSLIVQPDQKVLVAGYFSLFKPNGVTTGVSRGYIARINDDAAASIDTFDPGPNFQSTTIALQADGKVVLGGFFTSLKSNGAATAVTRNHIGRVNADGSLDTSFDPNANGFVNTIAVQADGKVVFGGSFTTLQPNTAATAITRNGIARVNADGTADADFDPNAAGAVNTLAIQPDGRILIGGDFLSLRPNGALTGLSRNHLARLNPDGTVDSGFDPNANGVISTVVLYPNLGTALTGTVLVGGTLTTLQPNGSIYVGGDFANVNGIPAANLALLNNDGTINSTFLPNPNGPIYALMLQPDGRIVMGGAFTSIDGVARTRVVRYSADNLLDTAYAPAVDGPVYALAQQADGRLVIGGAFANVGGAAHGNLARLNADGSADASFNPAITGPVETVFVEADGKILVTVASGGGTRLIRLNASGTVDGTFSLTTNAGGSVTSLAARTDGLIYVGGTFTSIGGSGVTNLARLTATGAVDPTFNPAPNGAVTALTLQSDGKLVAGGSFTTVSGLPRQGLARFSTVTPAYDNIAVSEDLTTVTLERGGSSPQLIGVTMEMSTDDRVWTNLGQATRVGTTGNWQRTGLSLPPRAFFYIRVLEILPATRYTSSGLSQIQRQFLARPLPSFTSPMAVGATSGTAFFYASATREASASFAATGLPAGLTIDAATGIISGTPTQSGTFNVVLAATNDSGTGYSTLTLIVAPAGPPPTDSRFVNLSTNVNVDNTRPIISGFVITGSEPRSVLLRAVGPGLSGMVSSTLLTNPRLDLYENVTGRLVLSNTGWGSSQSLRTLFARLGAFALVDNSADAAAVITLSPGIYSIIVSDAANGTGGTVLAEIYDASGDPGQGAARLFNLSSRGVITATNTSLIGGFVITGNTPKRVLIRGIGPALASQGVAGVIADPIVSVFNSTSVFLAQNNDWQTPLTVSTSYPAATGAEIAAAATATGAFALPSGGKDAAVLITLAPGVYSAVVVGAGGATGATMVEIYEVPAN